MELRQLQHLPHSLQLQENMFTVTDANNTTACNYNNYYYFEAIPTYNHASSYRRKL
jgi:hypothetical protein